MERTIFVSPYISIVDQKTQVVCEVLEAKDSGLLPWCWSIIPTWRRTGKVVQCGAGWNQDAPVVFTTGAQAGGISLCGGVGVSCRCCSQDEGRFRT